MAAIELWRRGFLNQEAILLRNAIEAVATAAVLNSDDKSYDDYKKGHLDSAKSFTKVKKTLPDIGSILGKVNGFFSNEFVHLGEVYHSWVPINVTTNGDHVEWVRQMLTPVKFVLLTLDFISEWTCYAFVGSPRYWRALGEGRYEFSPTAEGRALMSQLAGERTLDAG
jgi:hypothetical protein